jgi:hypothetical protein
MLTGQIILDARHVLLLSFVMDGLAFATVLFRLQRRDLPTKGEWTRFTLRPKTLWGDRGILLSASLAAVSVLLLPEWIGLLGWMGRFLYKTEFFLSALLFLHITLMLRVCYGEGKWEWSRMMKNYPWMIAVAFAFGFLALCALWEPFGFLFDYEKNPLPYLLLSFVPSLLFLGIDRIFQNKCK